MQARFRVPLIISGSLLFLFFLFLPHTVRAFDEDEGFFGPPSVHARVGVMGKLWSPGGLDLYEVSTYNRSSIHIELRAIQFLRPLNDTWDWIDVPRFRYESNFGYLGDPQEGDYPYRNTELWLTLFQFFSLRWNIEQFQADYNDPSAGIGGDTQDLYGIEQSVRDFEVGIIGTSSEKMEQMMLEIGYFRTYWKMPVAVYSEGLDVKPQLFVPEYRFGGIYLGARVNPIEEIWPMETSLFARFGTGEVVSESGSGVTYLFADPEDNPLQIFGLEGAFRFERPVNEWLKAGVSLRISWELVNADYYTAGLSGRSRLTRASPVDLHYKATVFAHFFNFLPKKEKD